MGEVSPVNITPYENYSIEKGKNQVSKPDMRFCKTLLEKLSTVRL